MAKFEIKDGVAIIPEGTTAINYGDFGDFRNCKELTSIIIPDGVMSIGEYAFNGCSSLTSIVIPDSVTWIDNSSFRGCSSLTSVVIPDGVISIGQQAFSNCSSLTSITIPNSVKYIGLEAFRGCSALTAITLPEGVTNIENGAFRGCSALTSITIPNSVTWLSPSVFCECSALTSIVIPDGVISIGWSCFEGCSSLTSIIIPASLTSIEDKAFRDCSALTSIVVAEKNPRYASYENCNAIIDISTSNHTLILGCSQTIIPETVTSIGERAFHHSSSLTEIVIPKGVKQIKSYAFCACSNLTTITLPVGVNKISENAFSDCDQLTTIYVPAKKADYYLQRLPETLHSKIVELAPEKKTVKKSEKSTSKRKEQNNTNIIRIDVYSRSIGRIKLTPIISDEEVLQRVKKYGSSHSLIEPATDMLWTGETGISQDFINLENQIDECSNDSTYAEIYLVNREDSNSISVVNKGKAKYKDVLEEHVIDWNVYTQAGCDYNMENITEEEKSDFDSEFEPITYDELMKIRQAKVVNNGGFYNAESFFKQVAFDNNDYSVFIKKHIAALIKDRSGETNPLCLMSAYDMGKATVSFHIELAEDEEFDIKKLRFLEEDEWLYDGEEVPECLISLFGNEYITLLDFIIYDGKIIARDAEIKGLGWTRSTGGMITHTNLSPVKEDELPF